MAGKGWRWPWTRIAWAKTVEHITPGAPRAIVFDAEARIETHADGKRYRVNIELPYRTGSAP